MKNLGEFLIALYKDSGADEGSINELAAKVSTVEISDDLVTKFNQTYLTEASAKANTKLINHFKALNYKGLDEELKQLYPELELPDEAKTELDAIFSSTKRAAALVRKVKELTEAKAGASKEDKGELNKKIAALNSEIALVKTTAKAEVDAEKKSYELKVNDLFLSQFLSTQKYASDGYKDEDFLLPKTKIQNALKERNLVARLDGKEFKLQTEDGVDYFENNTKVDFKNFSEKILSDSKLLMLTDTTKKPAGSTTATATGTNISPMQAKSMAQLNSMLAEAEGK